MPFIVSITGKSDSGKTTLILKLLPELKKAGYKVAVAKHCPRGFNLDIEGKDSWRFSRAGSEGIFLSSPAGEAVMRTKNGHLKTKDKLLSYFPDFDIILMEGYREEPDIRRIHIVSSRTGITDSDLLFDHVVAYVSDIPLRIKKPIYTPDDIPGIISFIEKMLKNNQC